MWGLQLHNPPRERDVHPRQGAHGQAGQGWIIDNAQRGGGATKFVEAQWVSGVTHLRRKKGKALSPWQP